MYAFEGMPGSLFLSIPKAINEFPVHYAKIVEVFFLIGKELCALFVNFMCFQRIQIPLAAQIGQLTLPLASSCAKCATHGQVPVGRCSSY